MGATGPRRELEVAAHEVMLALLNEVGPSTDLARLVKRVCENELPWVVVNTAALEAWQMRDPIRWDQVREWLAAKGVVIVRI